MGLVESNGRIGFQPKQRSSQTNIAGDNHICVLKVVSTALLSLSGRLVHLFYPIRIDAHDVDVLAKECPSAVRGWTFERYEWSWSDDDTRLRTIGRPRSVLLGDSPEVLFTAAESVFVPPRPKRPEKSFVYGDGTPLDDECVQAFRSVGRRAFENAYRFTWEPGDVLIINNETVMHARDPFTPPRRILVSLLGRIPGGHPYSSSESDDTSEHIGVVSPSSENGCA